MVALLPTTEQTPQFVAVRPFLDAARAGGVYTVARVDAEAADLAMLRAMGLRSGAMIRVCRTGEPTIVEVISGHTCRCQCRCRIGIARAVARRITLEREG